MQPIESLRGKWIPVACGVAVFAGAIGVVVWRGRRHPLAPPPAVTAAALAQARNEVTLQGKIRPRHMVGVAAGVPGFIEAFLAEPGQEVYEGQVLARVGAQGLESAREASQAALEHAQEQVSKDEATVNAARLELSRAEADAQRARMALDRAQRGRDRQQALFREGATPRLVYDKAVAEHEAAQRDFDLADATVRTGREHVQGGANQVNAAKTILTARMQQLEEAQENLAAAEIHSPVDGFLVSRKGEIGANAAEMGEDLFRIATDVFALETAVEPKPEVLKRIGPGQPALVLVLDLQNVAMQGVVREIRGKEAIIEFDSTLPAIKPGMQVDVRLKLE